MQVHTKPYKITTKNNKLMFIRNSTMEFVQYLEREKWIWIKYTKIMIIKKELCGEKYQKKSIKYVKIKKAENRQNESIWSIQSNRNQLISKFNLINK